MIKETRGELKLLLRAEHAIERQYARLQTQERKAISAIVRTTSKQTKGLAKQLKELEKRRLVLTGRLS